MEKAPGGPGGTNSLLTVHPACAEALAFRVAVHAEVIEVPDFGHDRKMGVIGWG